VEGKMSEQNNSLSEELQKNKKDFFAKMKAQGIPPEPDSTEFKYFDEGLCVVIDYPIDNILG